MKHTILLLTLLLALPATAQQPLTLDSCITLALRGNYNMAIGRAKVEKASYEQQAARTNYFPKISLTAAYMRTGNELSLLSDEQKNALGNLGTTGTQQAAGILQQIVTQSPELAPLVQQLSGLLPQFGTMGNAIGGGLVDALRTDTRNLSLGSILLTQPLYMGGKIRAYDRITRSAQTLAGEQLRASQHEVRLQVETAYWQVVSLVHKKKLAESYRDMLARLDSDVVKMMNEGIATKANELAVSVKLNEAEMTLTKVQNGLTLSRMLLCQHCNLPLNSSPRLADEEANDIPTPEPLLDTEADEALQARPEMRSLAAAEEIYRQKIKVERAAFLPQVALIGGYALSNPSMFNSFEKKFKGTWAVGIMLKMPIWNWGEGRYKVRAANADAVVAELKRRDAAEKIKLQVAQEAIRVNEANKQLTLARHHKEKAEENLRTAHLGFNEGVVATSDILAAQTAWVQAQNDVIDAQITIRLANAAYNKAIGSEANR